MYLEASPSFKPRNSHTFCCQDCKTTTIDHSNQTGSYYPCLHPDIFQPTDLNVENWMQAAAAMNTKEICLTAHHEGRVVDDLHEREL